MFFEKTWDHKLDIKLSRPKEPQSTSCKHMKMNRANRPVEPHCKEIWITPTHVFEI